MAWITRLRGCTGLLGGAGPWPAAASQAASRFCKSFSYFLQGPSCRGPFLHRPFREGAGVNIEPGDVVVADDDGVGIVPKKLEVEVAGKEQKRKDDEDGKRQRLAAGEFSLDMYKMREGLQKAGLIYVDKPEDV